MRTISATLLANSRGMRSRAAVRATVANKRWRWAQLNWNANDDLFSDMALTGSTIVRVRVSGTNVQTARVTNPATQSQWETWTTVVTAGASSGSDCAIALRSADNTNLRIFYQNATHIRYILSTDSGATWGSPANVVAISGTVYLGADNDCVFYQEGGVCKCYQRAYGIFYSWGAMANWTAPGTFTTPGGIGCHYDADNSGFLVAAAGDGKVWVCTYKVSTDTYSDSLQVAPGGTGSAGTGGALRAPSPFIVSDDADKWYCIAWIDDFQGDNAQWAQPVVLRSREWGHFGDETALACWAATSHKRTAALFVAATRRIYAANNATVCHALGYEADDTSQKMTTLNIAEYSRAVGPTGGRIRIMALDTGVAWRIPGKAGTAGEPLQALAEVIVERGYGTGTAMEYEPLDPHYIVSAEVTQGHHYRRLVIDAVDGLGLLALWTPGEVQSWTSKTVAWLAAEICATVGLQFSCPAGTLTYTPATFTIPPGRNGLAALQDVLSLAGAVAWCLEDGTIYGAELYNYSPASHLDLGDAGEILQGDLAVTVPGHTSSRIIGYNASSGIGYAVDNQDTAMALGLRRIHARYDARLDSDAQAQIVANYLWTEARMQLRALRITVPMRPDAEIYDLADINVTEIADAGSKRRRITGITESWQPTQPRLISTLTLTEV